MSTFHEMLNDYYDFRIWIESSPEVGFQRGLLRDKTEYKVDTEDDWINKWMPEEKRYIEAHKPQEKADYIVDGNEEQ